MITGSNSYLVELHLNAVLLQGIFGPAYLQGIQALSPVSCPVSHLLHQQMFFLLGQWEVSKCLFLPNHKRLPTLSSLSNFPRAKRYIYKVPFLPPFKFVAWTVRRLLLRAASLLWAHTVEGNTRRWCSCWLKGEANLSAPSDTYFTAINSEQGTEWRGKLDTFSSYFITKQNKIMQSSVTSFLGETVEAQKFLSLQHWLTARPWTSELASLPQFSKL